MRRYDVRCRPSTVRAVWLAPPLGVTSHCEPVRRRWRDSGRYARPALTGRWPRGVRDRPVIAVEMVCRAAPLVDCRRSWVRLPRCLRSPRSRRTGVSRLESRNASTGAGSAAGGSTRIRIGPGAGAATRSTRGGWTGLPPTSQAGASSRRTCSTKPSVTASPGGSRRAAAASWPATSPARPPRARRRGILRSRPRSPTSGTCRSRPGRSTPCSRTRRSTTSMTRRTSRGRFENCAACSGPEVRCCSRWTTRGTR